jgi:hypothetical protein
MNSLDTRKAEIEAAIAAYQMPYKSMIIKIVGAAMQSGKIDDLLIRGDILADATHEQDTKQATDFVLVLPSLRIGFRVRKPAYFFRYRKDLTLRSNPRFSVLDGGDYEVDYIAEFEKLIKGTHAHLNIYGYLDPGGNVQHWVAYRPDKIKAWIDKESSIISLGRSLTFLFPRGISGPIPNGDKTYFRTVSMTAPGFPRDAVVANSGYVDALWNPKPYPGVQEMFDGTWKWWEEFTPAPR